MASCENFIMELLKVPDQNLILKLETVIVS